MAGHVRYTALLDACVLFPVLTCDALMSVAADGMFAAKWTREIDREWTSNLETYKGAPAGAFDARRDCMHDACPDWEVEEAAWRAILPCVRLPDANDHHVLAAAIAGHADCIVKTNLADFPHEAVAPFGIETLHPDDFLRAQFDLAPFRVLAAFKAMRARRRNPVMTANVFSQAFEKSGLVKTAAVLSQAVELI